MQTTNQPKEPAPAADLLTDFPPGTNVVLEGEVVKRFGALVGVQLADGQYVRIGARHCRRRPGGETDVSSAATATTTVIVKTGK